MSLSTLDYEAAASDRPRHRPAVLVLGVSGAIIATPSWLLFLHAAHGEPFMVYDPADAAAFFVLGPLLIVLWLAWALALVRLAFRHAIPPPFLLALLVPVAGVWVVGLAVYEVYLPDFLSM